MNGMKRAFSLLVIFAMLMLLPNAGGAVAQQGDPVSAQGTALGTAFTYQGLLKDGTGAPVTYTACDFQFGLWDAATVGNQVGTTQTVTSTAVTNGYFTVGLDFLAKAFDGNARWLDVLVRCPAGSGTYTPLTPLQPITPAPYALYAVNAGIATSANTAVSAGTATNFTGALAGDVSGLQGTTTVTGLQSQPVATAKPVAGQVLTFGSDGYWEPATPRYQNRLVVAKSGGDFTTVTDALDSITDASATNPYLIYVAPGVYTETVTMKPHVDIEGAGELTTKITYTGTSSVDTGTVVGANNAELRFLTVENTGGDQYATAIYNTASMRLTHVTALASGGTASDIGVWNTRGSGAAIVTMTNVSAWASGVVTTTVGVANTVTGSGSMMVTMSNVSALASGGINSAGMYNSNAGSGALTMTLLNSSAFSSGGQSNTGVYNKGVAMPIMTNVSAAASGGTSSTNHGVYNDTSSPTMTNVSAAASGGGFACGVFNQTSSPTMFSVNASGSGGTNNHGMCNTASSATIHNSVITGSGGASSDGISSVGSGGPYTVTVDASQITGSTNTISQSASYTSLIGASKLDGGAVGASGTYTCTASYNGSYAALPAACR